jgi:hypothetical protein
MHQYATYCSLTGKGAQRIVEAQTSDACSDAMFNNSGNGINPLSHRL